MAMKNCNANTPSMRSILCTLILILCAGAVAFAQAGRGSISGLVTDPTGAVVPGAKLTLLNHATGVEQRSVTTAAGLYTFVSLNPGVYQVTASQKGFESVAQDNVKVTVDQVTTVNIALRMGSVSDTVTVSESVDLVETSNSTVGQLISSETIDRVPLLTRNVFELVQLSAGVTPANGSPNSSSSQAITNISSGRPGVDVSSYTINGAILGSVYYMLDGSPLGVAEQNAGAIIPALDIPEDGVDEYRVETQNTPASYQSGGAGVISLVSKSGGNQFHGDGFVVLRPNVLAANDYFNKQSQLGSGSSNQSPDFHRYQEGGSISGPILHKSFSSTVTMKPPSRKVLMVRTRLRFPPLRKSKATSPPTPASRYLIRWPPIRTDREIRWWAPTTAPDAPLLLRTAFPSPTSIQSHRHFYPTFPSRQ
jgi:hypothetical protein